MIQSYNHYKEKQQKQARPQINPLLENPSTQVLALIKTMRPLQITIEIPISTHTVFKLHNYSITSNYLPRLSCPY